METLLIKTKHRIIPLFYRHKRKDKYYFDVFDANVSIQRDLRRIGAENLSYINGKSRLQCAISSSVLNSIQSYLMHPVKFKPELVSFGQK